VFPHPSGHSWPWCPTGGPHGERFSGSPPGTRREPNDVTDGDERVLAVAVRDPAVQRFGLTAMPCPSTKRILLSRPAAPRRPDHPRPHAITAIRHPISPGQCALRVRGVPRRRGSASAGYWDLVPGRPTGAWRSGWPGAGRCHRSRVTSGSSHARGGAGTRSARTDRRCEDGGCATVVFGVFLVGDCRLPGRSSRGGVHRTRPASGGVRRVRQRAR
jgi:hypothetical protein